MPITEYGEHRPEALHESKCTCVEAQTALKFIRPGQTTMLTKTTF